MKKGRSRYYSSLETSPRNHKTIEPKTMRFKKRDYALEEH